jgi:hypothetical protein
MGLALKSMLICRLDLDSDNMYSMIVKSGRNALYPCK